MLEAGVKFDDDYMSIQDGQTITARNELLLLLTVFDAPPPTICHVSPHRVSGTGDSNNTTLGKW